MIYNEYVPSEDLKPYIKTFWTLEDTLSEKNNHVNKILPSGFPELIFLYKDNFQLKLLPSGIIILKAFFIIHMEQFFEAIAPENIGILGVRFQPYGLSAFTKIRMDRLSNNIYHVNDILDRPPNQLFGSILASENNSILISHVEEYLRDLKLNVEPNKFQLAKDITDDIFNKKGQVKIESCYRQFGQSGRNIQMIFKKIVGISPKELARIFQFQHSLKLLQESKNLTGTALDAGYYDQAHFINHFKCICGESPLHYLNKNCRYAIVDIIIRGRQV